MSEVPWVDLITSCTTVFVALITGFTGLLAGLAGAWIQSKYTLKKMREARAYEILKGDLDQVGEYVGNAAHFAERVKVLGLTQLSQE